MQLPPLGGTPLDNVARLIYRPPRQVYDAARSLPGPAIRIAGRAYRRDDLQLAGACSWYSPCDWPTRELLPCVIFLHGNSGCRLDAYDAARTTSRTRTLGIRTLLPLNITVFALDLSGSGLEFVSLGVRESEDVRCAVGHLRASGCVSRVGLWGRSMGAATAILYASRDPSVAGMVLDSPFSNLTDLMAELAGDLVARPRLPRLFVRAAVALLRSHIQRKAGFDVAALDVRAAARGCASPALFGHASGDTFVRPAHSELLASDLGGPARRLLFPGGHNSPRPASFLEAAAAFLVQQLAPPPPGPPTPRTPARATPLSPPASASTTSPGAATPFGTPFATPCALSPEQQQQQQWQQQRPSPPPPPLPPRPSQMQHQQQQAAAHEAATATLLSMGFPRAGAEAALRRCGGCVEAAAAWLVDGGEGVGGAGAVSGDGASDDDDAALAAALARSLALAHQRRADAWSQPA